MLFLENLLFFIAGIIFVLIILPLCDSISVIISSLTEVIKGKCAVKVADMNKKISKITEEGKPRQIGFITSKEEDDNEDDEIL